MVNTRIRKAHKTPKVCVSINDNTRYLIGGAVKSEIFKRRSHPKIVGINKLKGHIVIKK